MTEKPLHPSAAKAQVACLAHLFGRTHSAPVKRQKAEEIALCRYAKLWFGFEAEVKVNKL
jgi:hypothetical protein